MPASQKPKESEPVALSAAAAVSSALTTAAQPEEKKPAFGQAPSLIPKPSANEQAKEPAKTTTAPVAPAKSAEIVTSLRGKTMEEILNEWQKELRSSVTLFHRKASEIAALDSKLLENSDKVPSSILTHVRFIDWLRRPIRCSRFSPT
jgi:nuclear pore complex protein Nup62